MNQEQLNEILVRHTKWLRSEEGGVKADPHDADLYRANLTGAYLAEANLTKVDLTGAILTGANLTGANLAGACLAGADLFSTNLTRANLLGTSLYGADLAGADLTGADLTGAILTGANLARVNLTSACLAKVYLSDAVFNQTKGVKYWTCCSGKHLINAVEIDGVVQVWIGCKKLTLSEWIEQYRKIGEENGYTKAETEVYGKFLKLAAKHVFRKKRNKFLKFF